MVASHNEDTVRFAIEKMNEIGISPEDKVICFGQLLGMCDYITMPLGIIDNFGFSLWTHVAFPPDAIALEYCPYFSIVSLHLHQAKPDTLPTSTSRTGRSTKCCHICRVVHKRTRASWRRSKRRSAYCARRSCAACSPANYSTNQKATMCPSKSASRVAVSDRSENRVNTIFRYIEVQQRKLGKSDRKKNVRKKNTHKHTHIPNKNKKIRNLLNYARRVHRKPLGLVKLWMFIERNRKG